MMVFLISERRTITKIIIVTLNFKLRMSLSEHSTIIGMKPLVCHVSLHEGLDGGSWYSLITKNLAIYSLSLKF